MTCGSSLWMSYRAADVISCICLRKCVRGLLSWLVAHPQIRVVVVVVVAVVLAPVLAPVMVVVRKVVGVVTSPLLRALPFHVRPVTTMPRLLSMRLW